MEKKPKKKKKFKALRVFAKILAGLFILIFLLVLFIRTPWGQNIIVDKITNSYAEKTGTTINIDRVFITFSGNISVEGLYLDDKKGDTLIYSKSLEADIPIIPIIRGNKISINSVDWNGLRANIIRQDSISGFNFDFLQEAFASGDTTTTTQDASASQEFSIGKVNLNDFQINFRDNVSGIDTKLHLGNLAVMMKKTDLKNMNFRIGEASLKNTDLNYLQQNAFPESEEEAGPLPKLVIDKFEIKNVKAHYDSKPDSIEILADLENFYTEIPNLDLEANKFEVDEISLEESLFALNLTTKSSKKTPQNNTETDSAAFSWPDFDIQVKSVKLVENEIKFTENNQEPEKGIFKPSALFIKDFNLKANELYLQDKSAGLALNELSFKEASGINLKEFQANAQINNRELEVSEIKIFLNKNKLEGRLASQYNSVQNLIENTGNPEFNLDFPNFELDLNEIFRFQPALRNNPYLVNLSRMPVKGSLSAHGSFNKLNINIPNLSWGNTLLKTRGDLGNISNPEELQFDFPSISVNSGKSDLQHFVQQDSLGIQIPQKLALRGRAHGNPKNINTRIKLTSSEGNVLIQGTMQNTETIVYKTNLKTEALNLGYILKDERLGNLNLNVESAGRGNDINSLDASLNAEITDFSYNNYEITNLPISGQIKNGNGTINSAYKDENLKFDLESQVALDSVVQEVQLGLNLEGANLKALGLTNRNIKAGFKLNGGFKFEDPENYSLQAKINDGIAVYDNEPYFLGGLEMDAHVEADTTALHVSNQILNLTLESNADPAAFSNALQRHYLSYFNGEKTNVDSLTSPVDVKIRGEIRDSPVLNEVFVTGLEQMDTITMNMDFSEDKQKLTANIDFPRLNYNGNVVDSLAFRVNSDRENFDFEFGFNSIEGGPLLIKKTYLEGKMEQDKLLLDFIANDEDSLLVHVMSEITRPEENLQIHINPSELVFNKKAWEIPETNSMKLTDSNLVFTDFNISRNQQEIRLHNNYEEAENKHFNLDFNNFSLRNIFNYFNPEEELASGRLDGDLVVEDPFGATAILAGLQISNFYVMKAPLGILNFKANPGQGGGYNTELSLKEGDVDLDISGRFQPNETAANLDFDIQLNKLKTSVIEHFSMGEIKDSQGSIAGNMSIQGTTVEPEYSGEFNFNNTGFTVSMLNAGFRFEDENLKIDNDGIYFNDFSIQDEQGNNFVMNGDILTESYLNPEFDLQVEAKDFNALNASRDDNELFYGKAIFDARARITGNMNLPQINGRITINSGTDITYIMPDAELEIQERDGIVRFVNRENPDDILTGSSEKEEETVLSGFIINSLVEIEENASFNIIISKETGDNFRVTGSGELTFTMDENGRMNLSGRYEMSDGHYEMNLYELVNRRFDIVEGSSISWSGDPMDASLDVTAVYNIETSASSLMAARDVGVGQKGGQFRQELPFEVFLNVDGELMQPKLSFNLGMPEEERGALGGQVYGRIQQLNNQEEALNKQVFSLLVLNRFFPDTGSDGSSGGMETIARDNLNQALSDQLNRFSDQLLGDTGIELNFGVNSFTDYQGADGQQQRTQVDVSAQKKLLDDRLIIKVGSEVDVQGNNPNEETSPVIGNVSLEYLLTENGRYRLRGFRRNEYENVIDGQLIVSGIALIFTREFDKFRELWKNFLGEENQQQKE